MQMSAHSDFGRERFTGFFAGRFFYVTHHAGYVWNQKFSNQKNAAMGYVKRAENGCEVRFRRFRGALCPMILLPLFLFFYAVCLAAFLLNGMLEVQSLGNTMLICLALVGGTLAIILPLETFFESLTEESVLGRQTLLALLEDPQDPDFDGKENNS